MKLEGIGLRFTRAQSEVHSPVVTGNVSGIVALPFTLASNAIPLAKN